MLSRREKGHGRAVLLLHAFPLNSGMWQPQLEALRDRARLIAPDFPGFGGSEPLVTVPSLAEYAREVLALLDHLRVKDVVVVGLSMGGYVAFHLVEPLGGRLRGLMLADTRANADSAEGARGREELAGRVETTGVDAAAAEFLPKLLGETTRRSRPELVGAVQAMMMENSVPGVAGALRALAGRPDSTAVLARIACPVVCVAGEEDTVTPPDVARAMAERISRARAETIPAAGHLTNLEAPEAFNALVSALLVDAGG